MAKNVILLQDGATDELVSVLLLASMPEASIEAIQVLNADCLAVPTYQATKRLLYTIGRDDRVVVSGGRGWNPFPWAYRPFSMMVNLLPMVNQYRPDVPVPEPDMNVSLADLLRDAQARGQTPVTVLCLCPLTDVAQAIAELSDIESYVDSVVWMGGAYTPPGASGPPVGNVDTGIAPGANPAAEWNAYWDPGAVAQVFASKLDVKMFPLNATNSVLLTPKVIRERFLGQSRDHPFVDLAAQMYAMVAFQAGYSFWDTVVTAYIARPDLFELTHYPMAVDLSIEPDRQGTIYIDDRTGSPVEVATKVDVDGFYDYLVAQLKSLKPVWS